MREWYYLDGFPAVAQAEALDAMFDEQGIGLDRVIEIQMEEQALFARIEKRARRNRWSRVMITQMC